MDEKRMFASQKGMMLPFFAMLWKARLPYVWIAVYIAASMVLANVGIGVTEYTAEMFAGNVDFAGVILPFLIFMVASLLIGSVSSLLNELCKARIDRNLRRAIWRRTVQLPFSFFQDNEPRELISRITTDVNTISMLVMQVFILALTTLYQVALILKKIATYNQQLMLTLVALIPVQIVIAVLAGKLQFGIKDVVNWRTAELTRSVAERTGQQLLIKTFGTQRKEQANVEEKMEAQYSATIKNNWITHLLSPVYVIASGMQFILLILVGRSFYASGALSLAQWVAYFAFANQMINHLTAYCGHWTSLKSSQGATKRIADIMARQQEDCETGKVVDRLSGAVSFEDLTFGYKGETLFDHLNLTIPQGCATAVVGASGSGKTTLLNLLDRLFDPQGGCIRIGSEDIGEFQKKSFRQSLNYITQECTLYTGTIRENLVYGLKRKVTEEELDAACRLADIYPYITSLPERYDTRLGEGGENLSGGQRQKIAIARAMLKKTDYLLMDEALSALDMRARDVIWKNLKEAMKGKTIIYVAHNRQSVSYADHVVLLELGKITAQGSLSELIGKNEYLTQLMGEEDEAE